MTRGSLYRRALNHYAEQGIHDRIGRLGKLPPFPSVRAFFNEIIERSANDGDRRSCLLVNLAPEMAPYDRDFREGLVQERVHLEAFFRRCVAAGQTDGTITAPQSADDLAKLLLGVLPGVRALARTRPQREVLEGTVSGAPGLLEATPRKEAKAG